MSETIILAQPIKAELTSDGKLMCADPEILNMQFAAGGDDFGVLAIPALLSLSLQTARLKLALSRAVLVADANEFTEYWVESRWADDHVHLAILSSREIVRPAEVNFDRALLIDPIAGHFAVDIGEERRILCLSGEFPPDLDRRFVGAEVTDFLNLDDQQLSEWDKAERSERAFSLSHVEISPLDGDFRMDARPQFSGQNDLAGFRLFFKPNANRKVVDDPLPVAEEASKPTILFGNQLGPVLRQPLGRIIANAETIGVKLHGPLRDNYASYAKDIANAAKHLIELVDDLSDLEAVERAGFKTAPDKIELGDVARRVAGLLALKAADHQIQIITPTPEQKVPATAEFRRVLQILLNVVNNAIRYSPDGSKIRIDIAELNGVACITVSDQGTGIAPEDAEKIFAKFERLGRSGDGGSGLGLYISRRLARAMGGELSVSTSAGGGACFALTLPASKLPS